MSKPILVIKFGTASITHANGDLDETVIAGVARQVAELHGQYHIVLVSSGAVAAGKQYLKAYEGTISQRKAAAAIGNPLLLSKYSRYFAPYNIAVAQSLCERQHFSNRDQFLQLKRTYEELWASNIIPIANENDVVSSLELKFSDNDELATLIAVGFGASLLLFSTSVAGVLDREGKVVPQIDVIDKTALSLADKEKSALGLGGMVSKLTFARLATRMGIRVVIFGIRTDDGILNAIAGKTGTLCLPQACSMPARRKWLASGSLVTGRIQIDAGAQQALEKRHSLLAVGVKEVQEKFECGEVIEIVNEENIAIAVGRARISSDILETNQKAQNTEVAHADDIVLL
ncbi:glutamate 5-kinase [Chitinophaga oryzae]|uniref:Glutamate 5-kinase n=1 Tax=Chitinophaga oryzae TaxID=2725414 RepID=A0AAE6ZGK3_9BACT|nr:glutamate 5-kinase [Chitinophaga oryzae]QJB32603.1 glutamate 5-kinase [Chitinophaga oryzae]QJB39055.1 glutamate 5-kinase [Chitinophaga oryzae]